MEYKLFPRLRNDDRERRQHADELGAGARQQRHDVQRTHRDEPRGRKQPR